ncbi:MAG: ROK family transcriptional regulator [Clostridia bacterium]|nr:ROK family transcriptional regulator [Clostridia bacterium]
MLRPNNSSYMKLKNRAEILRLIRADGMSRAELSRQTGLSRAAVTIIVDQLLSEGIIKEGEAVKSESGRYPTALHLDSAARYAAGIDISREGCRVGVADFGGRLLEQRFIAVAESPQKTVELAAGELKELLAAKENVLGVGICVPGPVDVFKGSVLRPPGLDLWHSFDIVDAFEQQLQLPVLLEKDTNALALAEKNMARVGENFIFLLADHGLGCGLIQNGKLFKGFGGFGCELGHISVDRNGPLCRCGNRGCAELYASIPAAEKVAKKSWNEFKKDEQLLLNLAEMLALACINAVNLLEPEEIVLGGKLADAPPLLAERLERALAQRCMTRLYHKVKVRRSVLPENARTVAAAGLVLENFFNWMEVKK